MEWDVTATFPDFINQKELIECNLNPVVVLTDFMKSAKKTTLGGQHLETAEPNAQSTKTLRKSFEIKHNALGPTKSTPSPPVKRFKGEKRKRQSWDPSVEYEIEKIVGYHRDKKRKMWYLVKWKNWPSDCNTFERIGNLTGCHYELMKYFEYRPPKAKELRKLNMVVLNALKQQKEYKKLETNEFGVDDLKALSQECPYSRELFEATNLDEIESQMWQEYEYILRCLIGMCAHQDPGLFLRAQIYKLILIVIERRRQQLQRLASVEELINSREKEKIVIENKVDLTEFPDVNYIVDMKPGKNVFVPNEPLLGCECTSGCSQKSRCCGVINDSAFAYNTAGKIRTPERIAIYECNGRCKCPPTCPNRVVQRGRKVKLCIFKTKLCGWGVKTLEKIPKGKFVCEYLGELIPDSIAVVRDVEYHHKSTYLFDLDFFIDPKLDMYCIDATTHGNLGRFINHSCDPNLVVYPVWVDGLAPNLHRLAFFAKRNIEKGEEIQFDYENLQDEAAESTTDGKAGGLRMISNVRCQCSATNCREWIYGNK